jgi:hypothetical protein
MKFISKNANLRIVLRPGIPGNILAGQVAKPGVYVKFQDGVVEVKEEETINMMKLHPGFNSDYIAVDPTELDPFIGTREEIEPGHSISNIKYGHVEKVASSFKAPKLTPQMQKFLQDQATEMAKDIVKKMLPTAVEETIKALAERHKDDKKAEEPQIEEKSGKKEKVTA